MPVPLTWTAMRNDVERVGWHRRSDLLAAAREVCPAFGQWDLRVVLRGLPKPQVKRYGHYHYGDEHLQAVVEAAKSLLDAQEATVVSFVGQTERSRCR